MTTTLDRLKELAAKLPKGLHADWEYTSHFELTTPDDNEHYWWLCMNRGDYWDFNDEDGKRMGLLMDIAEEVCRLRDEGILK